MMRRPANGAARRRCMRAAQVVAEGDGSARNVQHPGGVPDNEFPWLTLAEAASVLAQRGILVYNAVARAWRPPSIALVRKWCDRGVLPARRIVNRRLVYRPAWTCLRRRASVAPISPTPTQSRSGGAANAVASRRRQALMNNALCDGILEMAYWR